MIFFKQKRTVLLWDVLVAGYVGLLSEDTDLGIECQVMQRHISIPVI